MATKGFLVLENNKIFEGYSFGSNNIVNGEVVFNTGMVGYPESYTDPSYYGQILVMTYPLIGNYGIPSEEQKNGIYELLESNKIQIRALIVSSYINNSNHWQARQSLSSWLKKNSVPAIYGIDTRTLTKTLRENGVMKGIITFKKPLNTKGLNFCDINRENLVPFVSIGKKRKWGNGKHKIVFIDCGYKHNQLKILLKHDTTVTLVPWNYNFFKDKEFGKIDAIFVSNGPGDPRNMPQTVSILKEGLKRKIPTFGICLGHQLLSLAAGCRIYKLKYGHRGQNQPVINYYDNHCYITSQNHGFAVRDDKLPNFWKIWFKNLNDQTNEGIHHQKLPFFSVQFHPEANPGPVDTEWLFDYFIKHIDKWKKIH